MTAPPVEGAPVVDALVIDALVLAAGRGSRFGGGKLLAAWRDGVLLDAALNAAAASPARRIHLVVGADARGVAAAGRSWAERRGALARLAQVEAPAWAEGLSASLKAGVAALGPDAAAAFVFLGDMPRVPAAVLAPLARAVRAGAPAAVPTWDGQPGHPALIARALFGEIAALGGDRGARAVLEGLGPRLARVPAPDDGVLFDVDTPAALARG